LRCSFCDTKYSYEHAEYRDLTPGEIVKEVESLGGHRVTITGGEPLIHPDIYTLIALLKDKYEINIETNGSISVEGAIGADSPLSRIIITMDYKCPCSGMEPHMNIKNLDLLRETDVLKFVVGTERDLDKCRELMTLTDAQIFISPVFGEIEPADIVKYMLEHDMDDCRVQIQMHKIIWDPNKRGV
jgi:7-carboxy-7-deazaguanine synthase